MLTLSEFIEAVQNPALRDDALFARLVSEGMSLLKLIDKDLATEFSASRPTITRWRNGTNAPHPAMRKPIYDYLLKRARALQKSETQRADVGDATRKIAKA